MMKSYKTPSHSEIVYKVFGEICQVQSFPLYFYQRKFSRETKETLSGGPFIMQSPLNAYQKQSKLGLCQTVGSATDCHLIRTHYFKLKVLQNTGLAWDRHRFKVKLKSHTPFTNLRGLFWKLQYKLSSIERFSFTYSSRFNKIMRKVSSMKRAKFNFRNHTVNDC